MGDGEARQRRLPDPRPVRLRRHGDAPSGDGATRSGRSGLADKLRERFDRTWWDEPSTQYADSLGGDHARPAAALDRRDADGGRADDERPRHARPRAGRPRRRGARRARERLLQRHATRSTAACSTRAARAARTGKGERTSSRSTTRSRPSARATTAARQEQQRATRTPTRCRCSSPTSSRARCRRSSPDFDPDQDANIDRCWTCRSMFMQAWGHYGTAWPVIHQQLGVRPSTRRPASSRSCRRSRRARRASRAATSGSATASPTCAPARGSRYTTTVDGRGDRELDDVRVGATLPAGEEAKRGHARRQARAQADRARDQPRRRGDGEGAVERQARRGREFVDVLELAR